MYRFSTRNGNYFGTPYSKYAHDIYFHLYLNSPIFKPYENDDVLNLLVFCEGKDKEKFRPLIKDLGIVEFFAMGNACDALKEVSDVVIGRVDEDGIYNFLMRK